MVVRWNVPSRNANCVEETDTATTTTIVIAPTASATEVRLANGLSLIHMKYFKRFLWRTRAGYSGSNCMQSTESEGLNYSPVLMGLIITLFIIIALLGAGLALMIRQVNAYREDVANYQVCIFALNAHLFAFLLNTSFRYARRFVFRL